MKPQGQNVRKILFWNYGVFSVVVVWNVVLLNQLLHEKNGKGECVPHNCQWQMCQLNFCHFCGDNLKTVVFQKQKRKQLAPICQLVMHRSISLQLGSTSSIINSWKEHRCNISNSAVSSSVAFFAPVWVFVNFRVMASVL